MKKVKIEQYHLHKQHPEKLQFEVYDLNDYRKKSGTKAAIPHSHSYYQIIWFFNACGTHDVDFKTYEVQQHTVLFIAKDQVHAFDDCLDIEGRLIHFNESFFMHNDIDIFLKHNTFKTQQNPCYTIPENIVDSANTYVDLISAELANRHYFGYEDIIRYLLKSLLIVLERIHRTENSEQLERTNPYELQYFKFKELLETAYRENLSVREYAEKLNVSSKTLSTITNAMVNKSPSALIADRVILEARRLLKFSSLQIGEIAFSLGFEDPSYFVKYFKRHLGESPSQYRNKK